MNSLKKFFKSSSPKDEGELAIIPSGQLYLRRLPGSPKSESECLYTDSAAIIREQSSHKFELIIQKVYTEGEEQLKGDDDEDDDEEVTQTFIIDQSLKIHLLNQSGSLIVSWRNPEDDSETLEFVVDETIKSSEVGHFMDTIYGCCFERKYQKSSAGATRSQLEEFIYDPELESIENDLVSSLTVSSTNLSQPNQESEDEDDNDSIFEDAEEQVADRSQVDLNRPDFSKFVSKEVTGELIIEVVSELRLYDPVSEVFALQDKEAIVKVIDQGSFQYWLSIRGESSGIELGTAITSDLNPAFAYEASSFIFNYVTEQGFFSWLLRFKSPEELDQFRTGYMRAQWEGANKAKWAKVEAGEQKYLLDVFNENEKDEEMKDYYTAEDSEDEESEDESANTNLRTGLRKESFSDSEDEDDENKKEYYKGSKNKTLTISYKNDRSYITRDDRIGVFKTSDDGEDLEFITSVKNLTLDGKKSFNPSKMMLHTEDRSLVMQGGKKDTLYRMDIERGQIVDEWKVKEDLPVVEFGPSKKFNQMTAEQTFMGISDKGLFKIDPRLSGDKIVESEYKTYATKNDFSSFGTTESGYIAVASNKGDIRLYDRLGIRAKSLIPAIGDAIKFVETSADGKWLLATCKTYLILIDLTIKNGTNAGSLGFQKSFGKEPPKARRLGLSPEHIAFIQNGTGKGLDFTKAYFNTGYNAKEQTIVSSSGPYAITWSLKKILRGDAEPYLIKSYSANVVGDNFKFGTDKNVIIALEDDVGIVNKKEFRKADRSSLAFNPRRV